jgi:protein subunit release factor B
MDERELCEFCLKEGIKVELHESEHLNRCVRCIKSSFVEVTGIEHYELIKKECEANDRIG